MITKTLMVAAIFLLTIAPGGTVGGQGPVVPQKGVYCWMPPTTNADGTPLTDLSGYWLYVTNPAGVERATDVGLVTAAPVPPTPAQACPAGTVGVTRDTSTPTNGNYSLQMTAYNTARKESLRTTAYLFTVGQATTPNPPGGAIAK